MMFVDSDLKAKCTDLESRLVGFKQQMDELRASANSDDKQVLNILFESIFSKFDTNK